MSQGFPRDVHEKISLVESHLVPIAPNDVCTGSVDLMSRMEALGVPAASVAVIARGELEWWRSYGTIEAGSGIPVAPESPFRVESITKTLAAIVALQAVEAGMLDLDADVNEFLTSWTVPDSPFTANESVTLRRLLTHTSGISNSNFEWEEGSSPTLAQVLDGEPPARNKPARVEAVPGSQYIYSNLGYLVIQQLLQDVTGRSFGDLVEASILRPLGMEHSTIDGPIDERLVCKPHRADGTPNPVHRNPSAHAQGELLSTPIDLSKLILELMKTLPGGPGRLLTAETVRMMMTPARELSREELFGLADGQGLGVFLRGRGEKLKFLAIGGGLSGSASIAAGWPAKEFGVAISTNGWNGHILEVELLNSISAAYGLDFKIDPVFPT